MGCSNPCWGAFLLFHWCWHTGDCGAASLLSQCVSQTGVPSDCPGHTLSAHADNLKFILSRNLSSKPSLWTTERTFWCGCTTFIPPALYLSTCVASTFEYHSPSCKLFHALLFLCRRRDALSRAGPCVSVALHIRCQWRVSSLAFLPMEHVV